MLLGSLYLRNPNQWARGDLNSRHELPLSAALSSDARPSYTTGPAEYRSKIYKLENDPHSRIVAKDLDIPFTDTVCSDLGLIVLFYLLDDIIKGFAPSDLSTNSILYDCKSVSAPVANGKKFCSTHKSIWHSEYKSFSKTSFSPTELGKAGHEIILCYLGPTLVEEDEFRIGRLVGEEV